MNLLRYVKALLGFGDVEAFWQARNEILKEPGKHLLIFFAKLLESIMVRVFRFCQILTDL